jgi:hypothetical protein
MAVNFNFKLNSKVLNYNLVTFFEGNFSHKHIYCFMLDYKYITLLFEICIDNQYELFNFVPF